MKPKLQRLARLAASVAVFYTSASVAMPPAAVRAQGSGWSQPIWLSTGNQIGWFPDVFVDATGATQVAWSAGYNGYDVVMATMLRDGQVQSAPADIVAIAQKELGESAATRPSLLVDRNGMLHLSLTDYDNIYYTVAPAADTTKPTAWLPPKPVSSGDSSYFSRMVEDSKGRIHLVYSEALRDNTCLACYHLWYRRSDDGGGRWSSAVEISQLPTGAAKPQMIVDSKGSIHVVWEAGIGGSLGQVRDPAVAAYVASYDDGQTWTAPVQFVNPPQGEQQSESRHITIAEDGAGHLVIAWLSIPDDVVMYQVSPDGGRSWSAAQRIPDVWGGRSVYRTNLDTYSMATDSDGNVHLVMVGRTNEASDDLSVLHMVWDTNSWSQSEAISSPATEVPEWPRIAIGLGNQMNVVWFTRDKANVFGSDSQTADYRVWYSRALAPSPGKPSVQYATPTPQPAATAQSSLLMLTPTPELLNVTPSGLPMSALQTETDDYAMVLVSVLPALALLALAILAIWLRRRN